MLGIGERKSRNKVIVGEPAIGSLKYETVIDQKYKYLQKFSMELPSDQLASKNGT